MKHDFGASRGPKTNRLALGIEYDGTGYCGWQTQPDAPNIQDTLNAALSVVACESISSIAAGRTDSGVHASGQVAHFDTTADRPSQAWTFGVNSNLPDDICVLWARSVSEDFHARYSATARAYRYVILNRSLRSALWRHRCWWVRQSLDVDAMRRAASYLLGTHDFSAFRAAACQAKSPVRTIRSLSVIQTRQTITVKCEANAFLHHMVRNIVGSLVHVGRGEEPAAWIRDVLAARDRRVSGMTAPAQGLELIGVRYPASFDIPVRQATSQSSDE